MNDPSFSEAGMAMPNAMKFDKTLFQADFAMIFFALGVNDALLLFLNTYQLGIFVAQV